MAYSRTRKHPPTWPKTFALAFGAALVVVLLLQVYLAAL